jgi:hypothetical protein
MHKEKKLSIPLSVLTGIVIGVVIPSGFFVAEYWFERSSQKTAIAQGRKTWMTLTPPKKKRNGLTGELVASEEEVDFDPRHSHYMKCAEVLITLASASLIFIPSLHFTSTFPWIGLPMMLLGFTVVYALCFMGFMTYFYEMFLFNPDGFTAFRSTLIFSLGFGALTCFAFAYFGIAIIVGTALSRGSLLYK